MLVLSDADVRSLITPADAVAVAGELFARFDHRSLETGAASRVRLEGGGLSVAATVDTESQCAGVDVMASFSGAPTEAVVLVLGSDRPSVDAAVESRWLAGLAAGATTAVGATRLAREGSRTVGLLGCGVHAEAQLTCLRSSFPVEHVLAYCRSSERRVEFCAVHGAEPVDYGRDAVDADVLVVATSSPDPVLRGDWLRPGTLVCAAGTARLEARELDNVVLSRAAFVCSDSLAAARLAAGDLVEPIERGVLDWLEVHELAEVVEGVLEGRQTPDDIIVQKTVGLPGLRLALARLALARAGA